MMSDEELNEAVKSLQSIVAIPVGFSVRHWRQLQAVLIALGRRGFGPVRDPQIDDLYEQNHGQTLSAVIEEAKRVRAKLTPAQEASLTGRRHDGLKPPERPPTLKKVIDLGLVGADGANLTEFGRVVLGLIDREKRT